VISFLLVFPPKPVYMRAAFPANLIFLDLIILLIFVEVHPTLGINLNVHMLSFKAGIAYIVTRLRIRQPRNRGSIPGRDSV
jgi:hypothetical protein